MPDHRTAHRPLPPAPERGFALVMVLILSILLYVIIAQLVTTARMARFTGENDALMARMRNHMRYTLLQVEEMLRDDRPAGSGGGGGGAMPMAGGGEEEEEDLAAKADGSQDAWFEPQGYSDGDLTTYVWVEDENRKFNLLTLVSPDEDFARESRARFIRLIDYLREDSPMDLTSAEGDELATRIIDWMRGNSRNQQMPRPPLKSDEPGGDVSLMLHLDELRLLPGVTDELFYDQVLDNRIMLGLESVLTVSTAWITDPGDPNKPGARGAAGAQQGGQGGPASQPPEPLGEGIKINVNTAPRPVLRCLFSDQDVPPAVIEAILRYRNEEVPPQEDPEAESSLIDEGTRIRRKMFGEVQDLEEVSEFKNIGSPEIKERFYELTTTRSHVFTVHMASVFKRNEENRVFVMRRAASILVRLDDGDEVRLHPIVRLEDRAGLRVMPIDFLDRWEDEQRRMMDVDEFAREERSWNPFFLEFYKPRDQR